MKTFLALFLLAAGLAHADPYTEKLNAKTVQESLDLCKRSGCNTCGTFRYDHRGEVQYNRSFCEVDFARREEERRLKAEDQAIRQRYGSQS